MADDYARATAAPNSIRLAGRDFLVSKFTPRDIGELQAWLKSEIPNPREEAKRLIQGVPDAVALQIWRDLNEEAKDWPPSFGSEKATNLLVTSPEGNARLLWVTLRKHNPGFDLAAARTLVESIELDRIHDLIAKASPEAATDPKA